MEVILFKNPTVDEYQIIKNEFGQLLNEYHFLMYSDIHEAKQLYFMANQNICRFNQIQVMAVGSYTNPQVKITEVDFIDFMVEAKKLFRPFTEAEEKAWRADTTNTIAKNLTKRD